MAGWQALAFTEPAGTPPLADVSAPINVGATSQDKAGGGNAWITADGLGSRYGALLATVSGSVSIGTTSNAGTLNIASPTGGTATICLNGSCTSSVAGASGGAWHNSQTFTSSGTFTLPSGVTQVSILAVGGGGGGGAGGFGASQSAGGGGGGGGGAIVWSPNLSVSGNLTIAIGTGGTGGPTAGYGSKGTSSTVAQGSTILVTALGGGGGSSGTQGNSVGGNGGNGGASASGIGGGGGGGCGINGSIDGGGSGIWPNGPSGGRSEGGEGGASNNILFSSGIGGTGGNATRGVTCAFGGGGGGGGASFGSGGNGGDGWTAQDGTVFPGISAGANTGGGGGGGGGGPNGYYGGTGGNGGSGFVEIFW